MSYFISGAILASTAVTANQARKSRKQAENDQRTMLAQQQTDQAAMRLELGKQTAEYAKQGASLEQQAQTAREQFETTQANYANNKLEMEKKAKELGVDTLNREQSEKILDNLIQRPQGSHPWWSQIAVVW